MSRTYIDFKCDYCGKDGKKTPYRYKTNKLHFCNRTCYNQYKKDNGVFNLKEYSQKRGIFIESKVDIMAQMYLEHITLNEIGKTFHIARTNVAKKLREAGIQIRSQGSVGKRHYKWRGGNERYSYGISEWDWRKISKHIKRRDGSICQKCGKENSRDVHHIIPAKYLSENKNLDNNLITLCSSCHIKIENKWWEYVEVFQSYLNKYYGCNEFQNNWIDHIPEKVYNVLYI